VPRAVLPRRERGDRRPLPDRLSGPYRFLFVVLALRGGNVQGDPKQCRKRNIPKSATNAAGSEMPLLSVCGTANVPRFYPGRAPSSK
jgi:hypothetical protein